MINDAYNANPASMRSALAMLGSMGGGARIAFLGEMRELGVTSPALHREIGRAAAAEHVNVLIAIGVDAEAMRAGALDGGMDPAMATVVDSHAAAAARVRELVKPGDAVLVKGSRGARMEEVIAHLRGSRGACSAD